MKKILSLVLIIVLLLGGLTFTENVKAKTVEKYWISMNKAKDYSGCYTKKIKCYKKKIVVWGALYNIKKNKKMKYKKRVFKSNQAIKYGTITGMGTTINKKRFKNLMKSYATKKGNVKLKTGGITITLTFKKGKIYSALWSS